jgi:surfactin synthase thioesterase subunit
MSTTDLWFANASGTASNARAVLFCLPHAGAGASAFHLWAQALAPDVEALPIHLPGRERRIGEPVVIEPPAIAAAVSSALQARRTPAYALYGHSLGGWLAFEVIRELRVLGVPPPARLYVGAARPPDVGLTPDLRGLSKAPDDVIAQRLLQMGGIRQEAFDHPELVDLVLRVIRADFDWLERYTCRDQPPLAVPIVAFAGAGDHVASAADMAGWARHTSAGLTVRRVPGGHLFAQDLRDELTAFIRTDLLSGVSVAHTMASSTTGSSHCVPLGDTGWDVWQDAVLRMAGFPADGLAMFASPESAAAADACLDGDSRERFEKILAAQWLLCLEQAAEIAGQPRFVEAVTWQNPSALIALDMLRRSGRSETKLSVNLKYRERVRMVGRYWQRYCGKNETIGFFGPSAWVGVDPAAPPVTLTHDAEPLRDRRVYLEYWATEAVADRLACDPAVRRWLPVTLAPQLTVDRDRLLRPAKPPLPLQPAEAAALACCDGRQAVSVVSQLVPAAVRTAEDGYLLLERLADRGIVIWGASLPVSQDAELVLRSQIAAIGDESVRVGAVAALDALAHAKMQVAEAAGDPVALRAALAALDAEFSDLTGAPPDQRAGQMYAGRRLCYEDTVAGLDVVFGGEVLDALAGPLSVLLPAARWMTVALADAYAAALRDLFYEVADGAGKAQLSDLWYLAQAMLFGSGHRPVDGVAAEFVERWATLFGLDQVPAGTARLSFASADLVGPAALAFPADRPGFAAARLHSPDVHVCAEDIAALERGEFYLVLGEMHTAWATFDTAVFTAGHPDPSRLREALAADIGDHRIRLLYPTDWPRYTGRVAQTLGHPTDTQLGFTMAPGAEQNRLLPVTSVTVSAPDGDLVATAPDGRTWPLIEFFAELISIHAVDAFKLVTATAHTPRMTVDKMVVLRETWRTTLAGTGLAGASGEPARYLAARAMRRTLGLPERVFVKLGTETKPVYVDLTSPVHVSSLCSMVRRAVDQRGPEVPVTFTELLPGPQDAWLTDGAGRRYFSELRLQIRDPEAGAQS